MTFFGMAIKGLRFHFRTHIGVMLGVALSTAVIVGALLVGDSLRYSLQQLGEQRLQGVEMAMVSQDRFFRSALASELGEDVAPAMYLPGSAVNSEGDRRANKVQVIGVEDRFWRLGNTSSLFSEELSGRQLVVNDVLAERLGVAAGDAMVVRVANPSLMPRDAPFSTEDDVTLAIRAEVAAIAAPENFGRFSLHASQRPPATVYVPLSYLQEKLELHGKANLLLSGSEVDLEGKWALADAALELREIDGQSRYELRSDRVFVDDISAAASQATELETLRVLTYFGNALSAGTNVTPFSMIAGFEGKSFLPNDLLREEAVINDWLAKDLGIGVGDTFDATYFVIGNKRTLEERTQTFSVRDVIPISGLAGDPELMPNLPGISDSEDCSDWEPGMPLDLKKIRDKDEVYWDDHRGTPKVFVRLDVAQELWTNRFGALTAIRYDADGQSLAALERTILSHMDPADYGLFFIPVGDQAVKAGSEGLDLGQYFAYFSFFIVVAALALGAMLFLFGIEQRREEIGALFAMGYTTARLRKMLLGESLLVVLIGSVLGMVLGLGYTRFLLWGLSGAWSGAIGQVPVMFHAEAATLIMGAAIGFLIGIFVMWWALHRFSKGGIQQLFAGKPDGRTRQAWSRGVLLGIGLVAFLAAVTCGLLAGEQSAGAFFGAGALMLVSGLCFSSLGLHKLMQTRDADGLTSVALGLRQAGRNRGRSLVAIGTLASGIFMVVGVGAFHQAGSSDPGERSSGTGGFAFVVETAQAVFSDLADSTVRENLYLDDPEFEDVNFVQLRLREGEEASCLNLNKAQRPRILGVDPQAMAGRFSFVKSLAADGEDPWALLDAAVGADGAIPAIADNNSIMYALMSGVGKTITHTDEKGNEILLRLVAGAQNSVLQGSVLIAERHFIALYPSASGYRELWVDVPTDADHSGLQDGIQSALREVGPEVTSTSQRLSELNQVQNTYISVFQALGGLGVLLGTIGLAIIVLRNVLERRSEWGVLEAMGYSRAHLRRMIVGEHALLLVAGLLIGLLAAGITILPLFSTMDSLKWLVLIVSGLGISGLFWVWLAAQLGLRGSLLDAIRND